MRCFSSLGCANPRKVVERRPSYPKRTVSLLPRHHGVRDVASGAVPGRPGGDSEGRRVGQLQHCAELDLDGFRLQTRR